DGRKLLPVTVSVKLAPPAVALLGLSALSVGAGFRTETLATVDVPPPGAGVTTVTAGEPAVMRSLAGIAALSVVALPNVVARAAPFHCTTDDGTKLVPVTVSVTPAAPTPTLLGETLATVGAGFEIDSVAMPEVPPPGAGVTTVTAAEPAVARSLAAITALSVVALT